MTRDALRKKANELPLLPGVYLMMDKNIHLRLQFHLVYKFHHYYLLMLLHS